MVGQPLGRAAKELDSDQSESTLGEDGDDLDRAHTDHDQAFQRGDSDEDDLEHEQSGAKRSDRDRGEGAEGDLTELAVSAANCHTRTRRDGLEQEEVKARQRQSHRADKQSADLDERDGILTELAAPAPTERHGDHHDEEKTIDSVPQCTEASDSEELNDGGSAKPSTWSSLVTELYIHSYLILFSILGTLARLGIEVITTYPNAPVTSPVLWANLGGSFFLGFLIEDRRLFREEWGSRSEDWSFHPSRMDSGNEDKAKIQQLRATHSKVKKTIPLFIGLTVGFCGSFTSFSSFILDAFLVALDQLPGTPPGSSFRPSPSSSRNAGYGFEASIAVLIAHVAISLCALQLGVNLALALDRVMPILPFKLVRRYFDPSMAVVGFGSWLGAVWLSIWPLTNDWRGRVTFALVFAPVGCLLRFYASKHLNGRLPSFPLGTFAVNVSGAAILGMCYDLQHLDSTSSLVSCQVLEGVIQGFCGCATTVSTWVLELDTLRRKHGYIYGLASISTSLGFLVAIMGSVTWTKGFTAPVC